MFSPSFGQSRPDSESGESSSKNARVRGVYCIFHCILRHQFCPLKTTKTAAKSSGFWACLFTVLLTNTIQQIHILCIEYIGYMSISVDCDADATVEHYAAADTGFQMDTSLITKSLTYRRPFGITSAVDGSKKLPGPGSLLANSSSITPLPE